MHTPLHDGERDGLNAMPSMVAGEVEHEVIITNYHVRRDILGHDGVLVGDLALVGLGGET